MRPTLIIDFDGTLCHDRFWRSLEPSLMEKTQKYLFDSNKEIVRKWMLGEYTSEYVNLLLSFQLSVEYEYLWNIFVSDCKSMFVPKNTLEKINDLRDKYSVALVTDNMDCFDRFTVPSLVLDNYFDSITNSYNEKVSKNDNNGELFQKVVLKNNSDISKSILIDDSEKSCRFFEERGGKSYLATKENPLSHWLEIIHQKN